MSFVEEDARLRVAGVGAVEAGGASGAPAGQSMREQYRDFIIFTSPGNNPPGRGKLPLTSIKNVTRG